MIDIRFYFPHKDKVKIKDVPKAVLEMIQKDKLNRFTGFLTDEQFLKDYTFKAEKNNNKYINITPKQFVKIQKILLDYTKKVQKKLGFKSKEVRYFVMPWFPGNPESKKFEGVNAMAPYYETIHLYFDLKSFTPKGLEKTLAHELNHLRYFENFKDLNFTIQEHMIAEGLAENFREYFAGGKVAPWSKALSEKQIRKVLPSLEKVFLVRDRKVYSEIFFGSKKYKRWTGYSVGYFLVKKFLKKNKGLSWEKIMKTSVNKFFENI